MATTKSDSLNTVPANMRIIATNEKVTGPPAAEMLLRSGLLNSSEMRPPVIMDNACGGGILTSEVLALAQIHAPKVNIEKIIASDNDDRMLSDISKRKIVPRWENVEVQRIDQRSVPLEDGTFTHVFNNFGVSFCAEDEKVLSETYRVLQPGGTAGFTTWKVAGWIPDVAIPAVKTLIPEAPALPGPSAIFPDRGWDDPSKIRTKLESAGFKDVQVDEYSFTPDVEAGEFAEATAVLVKVITRIAWKAEEHAKFEHQIESALLRYLKENFPQGKWTGQMVAIISRGEK